MLKKRVVILLTLVNGQLYRTKRFVPDRWYTLDFVDLSSADEVVMLDVTPGGNREAFRETVCRFGDECFVPLAVGGGISSLDDVKWCLNEMPCEKVVVETCYEVFETAAGKLGRQSLVLGTTNGRGDVRQAPHPDTYGEILIQSVEHDGSLEGYDIGILDYVRANVDVPIVIGSGCGTWAHMVEAFEAGADGCATSCIFHFTPSAIAGCKAHLAAEGVAVRA